MDYEVYDDDIVFYHDFSAEKCRRTRKNNALKWRKDRNLFNRYCFVDKKYAKRRLHKMNRKDPEIYSSTYYKTGCSLSAVCYGLT